MAKSPGRRLNEAGKRRLKHQEPGFKVQCDCRPHRSRKPGSWILALALGLESSAVHASATAAAGSRVDALADHFAHVD